MHAHKNATLLDSLFTSGVLVLTGAFVLAVTKGGPTSDKCFVVKLSLSKGHNNAFEVTEWHKALEPQLDSRAEEVICSVHVDSVELLVLITKLFIECQKHKHLVIVVLADALSQCGMGMGVVKIAEHWSVQSVLELQNAVEHG
jgi:hypothetical protein